MQILEAVRGFVQTETEVDMIVSNYVYEKVGVEHKKVIHYRNVLPQNQIFHWDDIGHFRLDQYILMHFCPLPDRDVEVMPAQAAEAYILCG